MNTFKPIHTDTYNCLEDVLECLASSYGREHIMIYANAWNFYYYDDNKNTKVGNRVEAGEYDAWKSLESNHGIVHKYHFTSNMDKRYTGKIHVITFGFDPEVAEYIRKGIIFAVLTHDPFSQGHDPIVHFYNILVTEQKPKDGNIWTRFGVIDKNNVDDLS